ncbi:AAA family ATPase [Streptomyces sp. NPDC048442]|uniref:AAA family ATPase n=1 Tax=Streptomyces sp. NPDC048442 TaxID=3154823 RepID=UPI00342D515B
MTALDRVTDALQHHGCNVRGRSSQCPAHEDRAPSLSLGERQDKNGVLLNCHAGCDPLDVVTALGLTMSDLFDEEPTGKANGIGTVVKSYPYADANGEIVYYVDRYVPKTFRPRMADGSKGFPRERRILYQLPAVLAEAQSAGTVVLCEGEKDVDNLAKIGVVATTMPGGTGMGWNDSYSASLQGVGEVVIIADRDDAGVKHARRVSASLLGCNIPHRIVQAAAGKDITDHLAAGHGYDDLVPLAELTEAPEPLQEAEEPPEETKESENPTQVRLAQLRAALVDSDGLDSIPEPVPLIDGILYRDSLAWIYGKPASAKSFVALDWAGCIGSGLPWQYRSVALGPVLYLVAEGVSGMRRRVRGWEEAFGVPMKNVTFLPIAVQLLQGTDRHAFLALVAEMQPALIIIDTQARVTVGADENSNGEMSKVVSAADDIRQASGACVLLVHHSGKNGLDMRGASAFEGAATTIVKVTRDGEYVEVHSDKQKDAEDFETVFLRMSPVGQSIVLIGRSSAPTAGDTNRTESKILDVMRESFGKTSATAKTLIEVTELPKTSVYRALTSLVNRGALRNIGTQGRPNYALPFASGESA